MSLFVFLISFSVLLSVCSVSVFTFWVGMELSTFFFISILSEKVGGVNTPSSEAVWKYFFVQSISSLWLVFSMVLKIEEGVLIPLLEGLVLFLLVILNIGVFPFHMWGYHLVESLSWNNLFILSSILKIPPLVLLSGFSNDVSVWGFVALVNCLLIVFFMLNNLSLNWLFLTSSNYLLSWLVMSSLAGQNELSVFIFSYLVQTGVVLLLLSNIVGFSGEISIVGLMGNEVLTAISILSLMGMPPFPLFWVKLLTVSSLISQSGEILVSGILLLLSVVSCYAYIKMVTFSLLSKNGFHRPLRSNHWPSWTFLVLLTSGLLFLF